MAIETLTQDLRHALRTLRKSPGFVAATLGILALGIGANTAIFSVVNAALLRPLPLSAPERLVKVSQEPFRSAGGAASEVLAVSPADFEEFRAGNRVFSAMASYRSGSCTLTGTDRPEAIPAATVSESFFAVLGVQPRLGRIFTAAEEEPGHDDVVILSHALWQSRFGGDPRILGRVIRLDGRQNTVVGVMGPDLRVPSWYPTIVELWKPLAASLRERAVRNVRNRSVVARLRPGVSPARAQAEMDLLAARLARRYPAEDRGWGAVILPLHEYLVRRVRPVLLLLLAAVGFVLLIACANVANLIGVRSLGRSREMAIRSALGASRLRLVRQLGAEALLLTVAGAGLGLYLARFGVALIVGVLGDELPRGLVVHLDLRVLAFTLGISLLVGSIVALAPSRSLGRRDIVRTLRRSAGRTGSDGALGSRRTGSALVVLEVTLSLVLLLGATLTLRSVQNLEGVEPGLEPEKLLTATLVVPAAQYPQPAEQASFFDRVLERVRALPGVDAAAATDALAVSDFGVTEPVSITGGEVASGMASGAALPQVASTLISPGALRALRIPLRSGRDFSAADGPHRPAVVLVSESMARRFWPRGNALGQRLVLPREPHVSREVVGIVGDVPILGLRTTQPPPTLYRPLAQDPSRGMVLVVRAESRLGRAESLTPAVAAAVHAVDRDVPLQDVGTLDTIVEGVLASDRFNMLLLAIFAALALLLTAAGIYSVLAYRVGQRKQEISVRMALGAQLRDVLRWIVVEAMRPVLLGLAIGFAATLALRRTLASFLFGVSPTDPALATAVALLLAAVALLASAGPAYQAARVAPSEALRE